MIKLFFTVVMGIGHPVQNCLIPTNKGPYLSDSVSTHPVNSISEIISGLTILKGGHVVNHITLHTFPRNVSILEVNHVLKHGLRDEELLL